MLIGLLISSGAIGTYWKTLIGALRLKWDGARKRKSRAAADSSVLRPKAKAKCFCKHPTGKSLLIYRIRVKPLAKKYFGFPEMRIRLYSSPSRPIQRGVAQGHQCGAGMRWTRMALFDQGA